MIYWFYSFIRKQSNTGSTSNSSSNQSTITEKAAPIITPVSTVVKGINWKFNINLNINSWLVRTRKPKVIDYSASYTENNFITAVRAMHEYILKPS